jgi:hypothetical protein
MLAPNRCGWTPFWNKSHSRSYDLSEAQVPAHMDKPGPGQAEGRSQNVRLKFIGSLILANTMYSG